MGKSLGDAEYSWRLKNNSLVTHLVWIHETFIFLTYLVSVMYRCEFHWMQSVKIGIMYFLVFWIEMVYRDHVKGRFSLAVWLSVSSLEAAYSRRLVWCVRMQIYIVLFTPCIRVNPQFKQRFNFTYISWSGIVCVFSTAWISRLKKGQSNTLCWKNINFIAK